MNQWWGYRHTSGSLQAKRYMGPLDVKEAQESPFCAAVVGPFWASDREDALKIVERMTNTYGKSTL